MRAWVLIAYFAAPFAAHAQTATCSDSQTGVTFRYPTVWVSSEKAPSYLGPVVASETLRPRSSFTFSSDGNLYKRTLLQSLVFSYFAVPAKDAARCMKLTQDAAGGNLKTKPIVIHGVRYQEFDGGDAGMCHEQAYRIDVAHRNAQCFIFERDFNTECYGAGDKKRKLTARENKALERHLDAIMQSVAFSPSRP